MSTTTYTPPTPSYVFPIGLAIGLTFLSLIVGVIIRMLIIRRFRSRREAAEYGYNLSYAPPPPRTLDTVHNGPAPPYEYQSATKTDDTTTSAAQVSVQETLVPQPAYMGSGYHNPVVPEEERPRAPNGAYGRAGTLSNC